MIQTIASKDSGEGDSVVRQIYARFGYPLSGKPLLSDADHKTIVKDVQFILTKIGPVVTKKRVVDCLRHGAIDKGDKVGAAIQIPSKTAYGCPAKWIASDLDAIVDRGSLVVRLHEGDTAGTRTEYALTADKTAETEAR